MKVMFNAREMELEENELNYEMVTVLMNKSKDDVLTVTYQFNKREASFDLTRGQSVHIRKGMVINAFVTDNA